jgi:hypothetical protein
MRGAIVVYQISRIPQCTFVDGIVACLKEIPRLWELRILTEHPGRVAKVELPHLVAPLCKRMVELMSNKCTVLIRVTLRRVEALQGTTPMGIAI